MAATRIEEFQQAFSNLQLQPLVTPEEIANFRVEYGDEWLDDLEQNVKGESRQADPQLVINTLNQLREVLLRNEDLIRSSISRQLSLARRLK